MKNRALELLSGYNTNKLSKNSSHRDESITDNNAVDAVNIEGLGGKRKHLECLKTFSEIPKKWSEIPSYIISYVQEKFKDRPTPVQANAIPYMLSGNSLYATAPTGSGKSITFLLPIAFFLKKPGKGFGRAVILVPTRELATQLSEEASLLFSGNRHWKIMQAEPKKMEKTQNVDILVSTPGKLLEILKLREIQLTKTEICVLDECDRLLSAGFTEQIDTILSVCTRRSNSKRGFIMFMFSATRPEGVRNLVKSVLHQPIEITIGNPEAGVKDVSQTVKYVTNQRGKVMFMKSVKQERSLIPPCLVFCKNKDRVKGLFHDLLYDQLQVAMISSDMTSYQRDETVEKFRKGEFWVLLATDVLARGVDFKGVNQVINYDLPDSKEEYIHRIGRTARAGRKGDAITLLTDDDLPNFRKRIAPVLKEAGVKVSFKTNYKKIRNKPSKKTK